MRRKTFVFSLLVLINSCFNPAQAEDKLVRLISEQKEYHQNNFLRKVNFDNIERKYLIHLPIGYSNDKKYPVIFVFHGGGATAMHMRWVCSMDEKADQEKFIVIYPDGTGEFPDRNHSFNVGPGYGYAWENNIDDIGFVEYIITELKQFFSIDEKRIYATGFSNGAMLCYRLASVIPDKIAAIAPIGAVLDPQWLNYQKYVPIIHFHGLKDQFFPFNGGKGKKFGKKINTFPSVMQTIYWYLDNIKVSRDPKQVIRKNKAVGYLYGDDKDSQKLVLWILEDGGHTWPGARAILDSMGRVNRDISANDLMWEFFQKHKLD